LALDDKFEQNAGKSKELLGEDVSAKTIERVAHRVGSLVLQQHNEEAVVMFGNAC